MFSKQDLFKTHWRHCVVSSRKTLCPLLSTGSTQEDRKTSQNDYKIVVGWDIKHQHKQTRCNQVQQDKGIFLSNGDN